MKKYILISTIILAVVLLTGFVFISTGFVSLNSAGYNYKAHSYKGYWCDYEPSQVTCNNFANIKINVKWNEEYMSSKQNEDGVYEIHAGFESYFGTNAWKTEHYSGKYYDQKLDKECIWNAVQSYSAIPEEAVLDGIYWLSEDGLELGQKTSEEGIMRTKSINNDDCYENIKGVEYAAEVQN